MHADLGQNKKIDCIAAGVFGLYSEGVVIYSKTLFLCLEVSFNMHLDNQIQTIIQLSL